MLDHARPLEKSDAESEEEQPSSRGWFAAGLMTMAA
jgi:hypothetical protein